MAKAFEKVSILLCNDRRAWEFMRKIPDWKFFCWESGCWIGRMKVYGSVGLGRRVELQPYGVGIMHETDGIQGRRTKENCYVEKAK